MNELDLKVAIEVMGLDIEKVIRERFGNYKLHNIGKGMTGNEEYDAKKYRDKMIKLALPHYSTNIADAIMVLETFDKYRIEKMADDRYKVHVYSSDKKGMAISHTLEKAACNATLKAVEEQ